MKGGDPALQRPLITVGSVTRLCIPLQEYIEVLETMIGDHSYITTETVTWDSQPVSTLELLRVVAAPPNEYLGADVFMTPLLNVKRHSRAVVYGVKYEKTDFIKLGPRPGASDRSYRFSIPRRLHLGDLNSYTGVLPGGERYYHVLVSERWRRGDKLDSTPDITQFCLDDVSWSTVFHAGSNDGIGGEISFDFSIVEELRPGDPLTWEYVYQPSIWSNGERALVNGTNYPVPEIRPHTVEWGNWPPEIGFLKGISAADWPYLKRAVAGHFLDEAFPDGVLGMDTRLSFIQKRVAELKKPSKSVSGSTRRSGCFHGFPGTSITFGGKRSGRILWFLMGKGPVFVVDCPGIGALYVFEEEKVAQQWAGKQIDFREARKGAKDCIVHLPGWEEVTRELLIQLGVKPEEGQ